MDKLVNITGARIGDIARSYADYRAAMSNGHDWYVVHDGTRVLEHCKALGFSPRMIDPHLAATVEAAGRRMKPMLQAPSTASEDEHD